MLAITETAAEAIKTLATDAELPSGGGLRIAAAGPDAGLQLTLADQAAGGDTVLDDAGARVFLEPAVAEVLQDMQLDVQPVTTEEGQEELRFALAPQE